MRFRQARPVAVVAVVLAPSLAAAQGSTREAGWDFGVDAIFQFSKDVKTAQDLYDGKTGHGEKEGVFLPAPDQVKD